jgi:hypothetical protein
MKFFISNLFKAKKTQTVFSGYSNIFNEFIKINGGKDEILKRIKNFGLGYKIEQCKLSNSQSILNTIEILQIFGEKQILDLSKLFNVNQEVIKYEIERNLYSVVK